MKRSLAVLLMFMLLLAGGCDFNSQTSEVPANTVVLNVSAAASLTDVAEEIRIEYSLTHPDIKIIYNFASSGTLQKQIEEGAPADLFISAGMREMDALADKDLIVTDSRKDLVANELVLIAGKDSSLKDWTGLNDNAINKVSIGTPETVPAGKYAKEALTSMELYEQIKPKLVLAKDVRQVITYVETGNVDAGLVYRSDTYKAKNIKIIIEAPRDSYASIVYPTALIKASEKQDAARDFTDFLMSQEATEIYKKYGFIPLEK